MRKVPLESNEQLTLLKLVNLELDRVGRLPKVTVKRLELLYGLQDKLRTKVGRPDPHTELLEADR